MSGIILLIILGVSSVFIVGNVFFLKRIAGNFTTATVLFAVFSSIAIVAITAYELYYYFFDERHCSSGDSIANLAWWSRLIGYALFFTVYYFTFKCFCGKLSISRWFAIFGIPILAVIHYYNTYSVTYSTGGCGQAITVTHFFTSETIGYVHWNYVYCDTNHTFESLRGGIYGSERKGNAMIFYRVNDEPVKVRLGLLFWQLEDDFWYDSKYDKERQEELKKTETTLRTCHLHKGKFKKIE
jgi:hypothetical protein